MRLLRPPLISGISNTTHTIHTYSVVQDPTGVFHTLRWGCSFVSCKGGPLSMAQGTLANLSTSAFIRTPPLFAEWIVHHLLTFPTGETVTILDPTAGEGDLLVPCQDIPGARLYGVEISADRAEVARQRLPRATILTSAFEGIT